MSFVLSKKRDVVILTGGMSSTVCNFFPSCIQTIRIVSGNFIYILLLEQKVEFQSVVTESRWRCLLNGVKLPDAVNAAVCFCVESFVSWSRRHPSSVTSRHKNKKNTS